MFMSWLTHNTNSMIFVASKQLRYHSSKTDIWQVCTAVFILLVFRTGNRSRHRPYGKYDSCFRFLCSLACVFISLFFFLSTTSLFLWLYVPCQSWCLMLGMRWPSRHCAATVVCCSWSSLYRPLSLATSHLWVSSALMRQNVLALVYDVALFYERKQKAPPSTTKKLLLLMYNIIKIKWN